MTYGGRVALADVDIDVAPGEIVGILGPNGAGKSTLLRLLWRGRRPSSGTLSVSAPRRLGIVPDESVHLDPLTGRENALLFARCLGLGPAEARRATDALLERFLAGNADRPVAEYSLGMRRRLVLVQALVHEPVLLLLDEPATGLDLAGKELLRQELVARAASGAAVVMASNDVGDVERMCGRAIFLRAGRKVLEGAPKELIARLGGTTSFELRVRATRAPEIRMEGVTIALSTAERLVAHSHDGSSPLPALCAAVLATGATIEAVDVRQPTLADVFLRATGEELRDSRFPIPDSRL